MTLRSRVLPALFNGVSQQPPLLRSPDQNEAELNTWSVLAEGVAKRPPSKHLAWLGDISESAFIHHINRDVTERYIVVIDAGVIKVFDHETGAAQTVNYITGDIDYLAGGEFRATTVADYTFIVNINTPCKMQIDEDYDLAEPVHYRWMNRNAVGADISGFSGVYTTVATGAPLQYLPGPSAGTYTGELASVDKLPETAANGTLYKITGSAETGFVSFYVVRNGAVWDETRATGLRNDIDSTTMPHCLVREADGTFTFAPFSWAARKVGDAETNPIPTFIDRTIRDVFFYQNRLGFLVDENVIFSCAGDFGNYWRNTILDYVASDVIDVAVTTSNVAILNFAIPFNDGIIAMADQTQFSLTNGDEGLSPESIAIRPIMDYEVNTAVRPVRIGSEVYFCGDMNDSSVVWEYTRLEETDAMSAAEITAHVPHYLPAGVTKLVAAPNLKALFAFTGTTDVYVYQFYWNGAEKAQSSWRKWTFDGNVIGGEYLSGSLHILIERGTDTSLEVIDLEPSSKPAEQDHQVYLDRQLPVTGVYNGTTDKTLFTLPFDANQGNFQLIRGKTDPTRPGSLIDPSQYTWLNGYQLTVPGNEAVECTSGEAYRMELQFSRQYPLDYQARPVTTGRLQLRTFTINYTGTAFFQTVVSPYGQALAPDIEDIVPAKLTDFTGKVIGSADLQLNQPSYQTGSYSFQIYGDADQATVALVNETHVGSTFVSAQWEGFFFSRS